MHQILSKYWCVFAVAILLVAAGCSDDDSGSGTLSGMVATPVFSPGEGLYTAAQMVAISCDTAEAAIYFTTNGSDPTTNSTPYSTDLSITTNTTLRAIAVKAGMTNSAIASASYTITGTLAAPDITPPTGTYHGPRSITITAQNGASIYYTTDGNTPTTNSTPYSGPFPVVLSTTVKAIAVKADWISSPEATAVYDMYEAETSFTWYEDGGMVAITNYTGTNVVVRIPPTIGGKVVKRLGASAFDGQLNIVSLDIPEGVQYCDTYSLRNCSALTNVKIPSTLIGIGTYAFYGCAKLTSVELPASLAFYGQSPFSSCTLLQSININSGCANYTSVEGVVFDKAQTILIEYPLGKTGASYSVPATVTAINNNAFIYNSHLTSIDLPDGLTTISGSAFWGCNGLTSVTLPAGVSAIGQYGFGLCNALTNVTTLRTNPASLGADAFLLYDPNGRKIWVPNGTAATYKVTGNWASYAGMIYDLP